MNEIRKLEVVERLNKKITKPKKKKGYIKRGFYQESELIDINSAIREVKRKIKLLERPGGMNEEDILDYYRIGDIYRNE